MRKLTYIFLLLSLKAVAQGPSSIATQISNKKTASHINIPGTRLYMIAPAGFSLAKEFNGLEKNSATAVAVSDSRTESYYEYDSTNFKTAAELQNVQILTHRRIRVSGFPGQCVALHISPLLKGYMIIFGDSSFCVRISAYFPFRKAEVEAEILSALNSIYYDSKQKHEPQQPAGFSLDDSKSRCKFLIHQEDVSSYFIDKPATDDQVATLMAYQTPLKDTAHIELLAGLGHNEIAAKYGISSITKRESYFQKINGYNVYQTESYGELNGKKGLVYSAYVASKTKVISILAITNGAINEDLTKFKKLLSTIQLK